MRPAYRVLGQVIPLVLAQEPAHSLLMLRMWWEVDLPARRRQGRNHADQAQEAQESVSARPRNLITFPLTFEPLIK